MFNRDIIEDLNELHFWVREKATSNAEVDFVYLYNSKLSLLK